MRAGEPGKEKWPFSSRSIKVVTSSAYRLPPQIGTHWSSFSTPWMGGFTILSQMKQRLFNTFRLPQKNEQLCTCWISLKYLVSYNCSFVNFVNPFCGYTRVGWTRVVVTGVPGARVFPGKIQVYLIIVLRFIALRALLRSRLTLFS